MKWHSTLAADGLRLHAAVCTAALSWDRVDVVMQPVVANIRRQTLVERAASTDRTTKVWTRPVPHDVRLDDSTSNCSRFSGCCSAAGDFRYICQAFWIATSGTKEKSGHHHFFDLIPILYWLNSGPSGRYLPCRNCISRLDLADLWLFPAA